MNDLIRVPVKADTVATFSFVIVLDLSKVNFFKKREITSLRSLLSFFMAALPSSSSPLLLSFHPFSPTISCLAFCHGSVSFVC